MNIDTRAGEAVRAAQREVAMIDVPESEAVIAPRRAQQRTRMIAASALAVLVLGGGAAAAVAVAGGNNHKKAPVVLRPLKPRVTLGFREVLGEIELHNPSGGTPPTSAPGCDDGKLVTPNDKITPAAREVILPDREHTVCYVLGAQIMDGSHIDKANAILNPSSEEWEVDVHFGDNEFVDKIGTKMVGKIIAIILDNVVYSAPVLKEQITTPDVTISGNFTEQTARDVAADLLGVDPSTISTPKATASRSTFTIFQGSCRTDAGGLLGQSNFQLPTSICSRKLTHDVVLNVGAVAAVNVTGHGNDYSIDIALKPTAATQLDSTAGVQLLGVENHVITSGTLASGTIHATVSWTRVQAEQAAAAINAQLEP